MTEPECILSVTTWKGRINEPEVPAILYSFTRQNTSYRYKVVLVLSEEEFPGKDSEVPDSIRMMADALDNFEILWTKRNTRALKKLNPTMERYPNVPVMTTDDDCILDPCAVQNAMDQHREMPKAILTVGKWEFKHPLQQVTYGFRLFPPRSLYPLSDALFMECFDGLEDDIWNAIRARLAGTRTEMFRKKVLDHEVGMINPFRDTYLRHRPDAYYERLKRIVKI